MSGRGIFFREEFATWLVVFAHMCVWFFSAPEFAQQPIGLELAWQNISKVFILTAFCFPVCYFAYTRLSRHVFYAQHTFVILALLVLSSFSSQIFMLFATALAGCTGSIAMVDLKRSTSGAKQYMRVARLGLAYTGAGGAYLLSAFIDDAAWRMQFMAIGFLILNLLGLAVLPRQQQEAVTDKQAQPEPVLTLIKTPSIWFFSCLAVLVFGGNVALLIWLPSYLHHVYGVAESGALVLTALLIAVVALMRLLGGWFIQLYSARALHWLVSWVALGCLFVLCYPPTTMTIHGINKIVSLHIEVPFAAFLTILVVLFSALGFAHAALYEGIEVRFKQSSSRALIIISASTMFGMCALIALFAWVSEFTGIYSSVFMAFYGLLVLQMALMYLSEQTYLRKKAYERAVRDNFLNK